MAGLREFWPSVLPGSRALGAQAHRTACEPGPGLLRPLMTPCPVSGCQGTRAQAPQLQELGVTAAAGHWPGPFLSQLNDIPHLCESMSDELTTHTRPTHSPTAWNAAPLTCSAVPSPAQLSSGGLPTATHPHPALP